MFLNRLNNEEKVSFLKLAHYIARIDGDFADEEKEIIEAYTYEMGIKNNDFDEKAFNLEQTLSNFKATESKKIVLIEIMALIHADTVVTNEEEEIILQICHIFNIDRDSAKLYEEWTKEMMTLYRRGEEFFYV